MKAIPVTEPTSTPTKETFTTTFTGLSPRKLDAAYRDCTRWLHTYIAFAGSITVSGIHYDYKHNTVTDTVTVTVTVHYLLLGGRYV
jgi:hypothetical protein